MINGNVKGQTKAAPPKEKEKLYCIVFDMEIMDQIYYLFKVHMEKFPCLENINTWLIETKSTNRMLFFSQEINENKDAHL